jgi:hypothetical protein
LTFEKMIYRLARPDSTIMDIPPRAQSTPFSRNLKSTKVSKPINPSINLSLLNDDSFDLKPAIINPKSTSQKFNLEHVKKVYASHKNDIAERMDIDTKENKEETETPTTEAKPSGFLSRLSRNKSEKTLVMNKNLQNQPTKPDEIKDTEKDKEYEAESALPKTLFHGLTFSQRGLKDRHVTVLRTQVLEMGGQFTDIPDDSVDKVVVPFFKYV